MNIRRSASPARFVVAILGAAVLSAAVTALAPTALAATCTVTSTAASGPGSLAQTLTDLEASKGATCSRIEITATGKLSVASPLPVIHYSVEIVGPGQEALTLDGGTTQPILVARLVGGASLTVTDLAMENGLATRCSACSHDWEPGGGALQVTIKPKTATTGVVRVARVGFDENVSVGSGGAILVAGPALEITDSRFLHSLAQADGGAVYGGTVRVRGSMFSHSSATLGYGGAVYADRLTVAGTTFYDGYAGEGGAAVTFTATPAPGITTSSFDAGTTEGHGGAIYAYPTAGTTVIISDCSFSGNRGSNGGAVTIEREWASDEPRSANLLVGRSTFDSNRGSTGGGLYVDGIKSALISNSTFSGNQATDGAALALVDVDATVQYITMSANAAERSGGGVWAGKMTLGISNSILWANTAPRGADLMDTSKRTRLSSDLFTSKTAVVTKTGFSGARALIFGSDPLLGPLGENGGPTWTMLPSPSSPVLGKGTAKVAKPPKTDQRGQPRIIGGRADMGAVEVG
jgi:hypothetical protein